MQIFFKVSFISMPDSTEELEKAQKNQKQTGSAGSVLSV
jgi:hypothetical protein